MTTTTCPKANGRDGCYCPTVYPRCAGWTNFPELREDPSEVFCLDHGLVPVIDGSRRCPRCNYDLI